MMAAKSRVTFQLAADLPPHERPLRWSDLGRKPTWAELCRLEPRLAELAREVAAVRDEGGPSFCANDRWYGRPGRPGFKARLCALVGWAVDHPVLGATEAYDVAYRRLYDRLPPCRDCWCW